jgi:hypothetical protein
VDPLKSFIWAKKICLNCARFDYIFPQFLCGNTLCETIVDVCSCLGKSAKCGVWMTYKHCPEKLGEEFRISMDQAYERKQGKA